MSVVKGIGLRSFIYRSIFVSLLALSIVLAARIASGQSEKILPPGEGCLQYRSDITGRFETIPLVRTDVSFCSPL